MEKVLDPKAVATLKAIATFGTNMFFGMQNMKKESYIMHIYLHIVSVVLAQIFKWDVNNVYWSADSIRHDPNQSRESSLDRLHALLVMYSSCIRWYSFDDVEDDVKNTDCLINRELIELVLTYLNELIVDYEQAFSPLGDTQSKQSQPCK